MTAVAETPEVEAVMRVLADHSLSEPSGGTAYEAYCVCTCGEHNAISGGLRETAQRKARQHVAREVVAALDPVTRKAKAEAWDDSAAEARDLGLMHDPAMGEMWDRNPYRSEAERG